MASVSVGHGFPYGGEWEVYTSSIRDPSSGLYWAAALGSTLTNLLSSPTDFDVSVPTARSWWVFEVALGSPAAGDQNGEFVILSNGAGAWELRGIMEDANPPTYYKVRLYFDNVLQGEGTTELAVNQLGPPIVWQQYRFTWLSGQAAVEVDGTYEINTSVSGSIPSYLFSRGGGGIALSTTSILIRKLVIVRGDSSADRPDETTQAFTACEIDSGQNGTHTGWASVGAVSFDSECYDDWDGGGANDGDTTYIYPPSTTTVEETAILDAQPTITTSYEHALWVHHRCRISGSPGGAKDIGNSLICDGAGHSDSTVGLGTSDSTAYLTRSGMFKLAPDGAAWDAAAAANLEIGVQGEGTAVPTGVIHTAIWGEWCKYALDAGDPPPLSLVIPRRSLIPLLTR